MVRFVECLSTFTRFFERVQQAAVGLRKSVRVHALHVSVLRKQADINAPGSGTIRGVVRPKTERDRRRLLVEAERVIGERYGEFDLGLADIAEDVGCSPRQLQRVLREVGGTDFRSSLLKVRMEKARQLLSRKRGGLTVREAARRCGYREASGLRPQFIRYFGMSPSDVQPKGPDYSDLWEAVERSQSP
jgi:AraC-like DNA-binding protein